MAKLFDISIVTPEKKVFEGKIQSLTAPGIEGDFGVLASHAAFATVLAPGVVEIKHEDSRQELIAVSGGYIEVAKDKAVLLLETAETEADVDVEAAKRRKDEKEKLLKAKSAGDVDYDKVKAELLKEISRLKAIQVLERRRKH